MTRILSALILLPIVIGAIWLSYATTVLLAIGAAALAFMEYADLARASGARIPRGLAGTAAVLCCIAMAATAVAYETPHSDLIINGSVMPPPAAPLDALLISATIVISAAIVATRPPGPGVLLDTAAALLPMLYIGLPLGCLAAVRAIGGPTVLLLLLVILVVSDTGQYYTGRAFGRRPLAPAISPKKTVEGAIGGLVFGTAAAVIGGSYVFAAPRLLLVALVGATITALGIVGDLFESLLKRSAGVKDSGTIIPGHGGVLDRIDSWLFAAPVYYLFVRYLQ